MKDVYNVFYFQIYNRVNKICRPYSVAAIHLGHLLQLLPKQIFFKISHVHNILKEKYQ